MKPQTEIPRTGKLLLRKLFRHKITDTRTGKLDLVAVMTGRAGRKHGMYGRIDKTADMYKIVNDLFSLVTQLRFV